MKENREFYWERKKKSLENSKIKTVKSLQNKSLIKVSNSYL